MFRLVNWIQHLDETVIRWIAENVRTPLLDRVMIFYTQLGNAGWIFILLSLVLILKKKTRRAGFATLTSLALGAVVTNLVLKPLVARTRPWETVENFTSLIVSSDAHSFPSGHTCAAFAFAVSLFMVLPSKIATAAALIAAAVMGFSRLYVGVHFLSDVLAGAAVGAACGFIGARIVSAVKDRLNQG